ncbi:FAD binding domain-containing protein [Chryseosolibacter indicus]|uniref:Xanthine dehydrogenase family protein subunit M n=1 Tax=Chryseosolibacter indicus TaxID=2782351 RepID=A0ABS5VSA1_9BACT|nr:xanthine dehydrogenase family protein subunit M [Chryseosolibacter indicus]MBT1702886.1 xanthine dehydrogenase family protein subunit M [Chryseosolibacter indicus]
MNRFSYTKTHTLEEAIHEVIPNDGTKFIAGGTNLIDLMRANIERPDHLIDITHLDLHQIEETEQGGLRLGALAKNSDTAYHELVQKRYPLLAKAILAGASPQLRNMATNGGNLLQRTRCYYFYDTATPCNKRIPGQGCSAIHGYNRIHAILGTSDYCIATHPSDMCVALAALDAIVNVKGREGERTIAFNDFHRLPDDAAHIDSTLRQGELITSIELPAKGFEKHYQYVKVRDRRSYAFALVSVAAALNLDGDSIAEARIALGGVAHKPWRDVEAETFLQGKVAEPENFEKAAEMILKEAKGYKYNMFKIELAKRAIVRALTEARDLQTPEPLNCYTYNRHHQL